MLPGPEWDRDQNAGSGHLKMDSLYLKGLEYTFTSYWSDIKGPCPLQFALMLCVHWGNQELFILKYKFPPREGEWGQGAYCQMVT